MTRQSALIAGLVVLLVSVLFFMFGWRPQSERIAEVEDQIARVEQQQATLRQRIAALEDVRASAPEFEADIAAAEAIVPRELAIASALRQLQTAADDAGVTLSTVSTSRPSSVREDGIGVIGVSVGLNGSYFQLVDFLRRIEDPGITPRGITWSSVLLSPVDYPTLGASLSGSMYADLGDEPAIVREVDAVDDDEGGDE